MLRKLLPVVIGIAVFFFCNICSASPVSDSHNWIYDALVLDYGSFSRADQASSVSPLMGMQSRLSSVSSSDENGFVASLIGDEWVWLGGYERSSIVTEVSTGVWHDIRRTKMFRHVIESDNPSGSRSPEPSALISIGFGLLGIASLARQRRGPRRSSERLDASARQ